MATKPYSSLKSLNRHGVADAAHHAQAGALGQSAHHHGDQQCSQHGRVLGAGALLTELEQAGHGDDQDQQAGHHDGQHAALALPNGIGPLQGEAALEELDADEDTQGEAHQAHHGVQVAAADTQDHPQGAAQEGQCADHDEGAQHEACGGGGAGLGPEFLGGHGHDERAQHQTDDLRPDVLHLGCAVHTHRAGDVPQEAGDAEAHVGGVAQMGQHHSGQTDHRAGDDHDPTYFFHVMCLSFALFLLKNSDAIIRHCTGKVKTVTNFTFCGMMGHEL